MALKTQQLFIKHKALGEKPIFFEIKWKTEEGMVWFCTSFFAAIMLYYAFDICEVMDAWAFIVKRRIVQK